MRTDDVGVVRIVGVMTESVLNLEDLQDASALIYFDTFPPAITYLTHSARERKFVVAGLAQLLNQLRPRHNDGPAGDGRNLECAPFVL